MFQGEVFADFVNQRVFPLLDSLIALAAILFSIYLIATVKVASLDGMFAAQASILAAMVAVFRAREAGQDWPLSILSSWRFRALRSPVPPLSSRS